ncbi:MAG: methylenetetrahydrofolate--tRNA-(uracil(54)-C(5))-methyltransferase (FADH(2)-oxidizing) TrmFO [Fibrobacter sp.]|mgnify:CR=1 FL=1|nr:methylenetetrahydrofolate--tRNA-(uracil(54)-C(5))-methyltransferase (FADH(2)-oxidizing) TrmFO [Fibrobacter sp.]
MKRRIKVIGGGLAGSEAALQLASRGFSVDLYEMRGVQGTPAHQSTDLAELVCSNSFKGLGLTSAHGLFKNELQKLGAFLMEAAFATRVPAGESLTVNRQEFAQLITKKITEHPLITLHREEVTSLEDDRPTLVASGPLSSDKLAQDLFSRLGTEKLHFFDAIAPVVEFDSINMEHAYFRNRWDKGESADFINCPLDKETYELIVEKLRNADAVEPKPFEKKELFEGCLPIEEMARRGIDTLRFGPLRPVGLGDNPETGRRWHAVIQLRKENTQGTLYNMVGFQTRLRWGTQKEIFSLIPALKNAEYARMGAMHRNTFIDSPNLLDNHLKLKQKHPDLPPIWFAGQITGAEGYTEAVATGYYAAWNMAHSLTRKDVPAFPEESCLKSLVNHLTAPNADFQPMNFNYGLLPRIPEARKSQRKEMMAQRAQKTVDDWICEMR